MIQDRKHRVFVGLIGIVVLILGSLILIVFLDWSKYLLGPHLDSYTELYFEDHLSLPKMVTLGTPFKTTFTIVNKESKPMEYPIKVYTLNEADPPVLLELYSTSLNLNHNGQKTYPLELIIPEYSTPRQKVVVELMHLNQEIHYWTAIATVSASTTSATF